MYRQLFDIYFGKNIPLCGVTMIIAALKGLIMADAPPTPEEMVPSLLHAVMWACMFGGVDAVIAGKPRPVWAGAFVLSLTSHIVGIKWLQIKPGISPHFALFVEQIASKRLYRWIIYSAIAVALLVTVSSAVYRYYHKPEANPFKATIKFIRTDWGPSTTPHLVVYYTLNDVPTASPLDIIAYFRIINTTSEPLYLEAWSVETAPKASGPWVKLSYIPASPHLSIYTVDNNHASSAVIMPDLTDSLAASPIQPRKEAAGWANLECPSSTPCLEWYQRIVLRDTQGHTYSQILDLSDYNTSLELQSVPALITKSRAPAMNLTSVPLLRPYPKEANRTDPNDETDVARLTK